MCPVSETAGKLQHEAYKVTAVKLNMRVSSCLPRPMSVKSEQDDGFPCDLKRTQTIII